MRIKYPDGVFVLHYSVTDKRIILQPDIPTLSYVFIFTLSAHQL